MASNGGSGWGGGRRRGSSAKQRRYKLGRIKRGSYRVTGTRSKYADIEDLPF